MNKFKAKEFHNLVKVVNIIDGTESTDVKQLEKLLKGRNITVNSFGYEVVETSLFDIYSRSIDNYINKLDNIPNDVSYVEKLQEKLPLNYQITKKFLLVENKYINENGYIQLDNEINSTVYTVASVNTIECEDGSKHESFIHDIINEIHDELKVTIDKLFKQYVDESEIK